MIRQSFSTGCFSLAGECKSYDCTNYRIFSGDLGRELSHIDAAIAFCYSQGESGLEQWFIHSLWISLGGNDIQLRELKYPDNSSVY